LVLLSFLKEDFGKFSIKNLEILYYESLVLNVVEEVRPKSLGLKKYLYLIGVKWGNNENKYSNFLEEKEKDFVENILKEHIEELGNYYFEEGWKIFKPYIEKEKDFEKLKEIVKPISGNKLKGKELIVESLINSYGCFLKEEEIDKLLQLGINLKKELELIKELFYEEKVECSEEKALKIYSFCHKSYENLDDELKEKVIKNLVSSIKKIKRDELPSYYNVTINLKTSEFIEDKLVRLKLNSLEFLLENIEEDNEWRANILENISREKQKSRDREGKIYSVKELKGFLLEREILNERDFFIEVCSRIKNLKEEIEDNINNEKDPFWRKKNEEYKTENECRDVIFNKLKDKYSDLSMTREEETSNNRVDIQIKPKNNREYIVQVECKRDGNNDLYGGIPNQLVSKYFSTNIKYGIYLVFYFGKRTNKNEMLEKIEEKIPKEHSENIEIICIDIRYLTS